MVPKDEGERKKWHCVRDPDAFATVHTLPLDDWIDHDRNDCVCGPKVIPVPHPTDGSMGWSIVHNSLDGRERFET